MRDGWTAERISLLQQLWAGGSTAESIAARLGGLSRAAVLGKVYRLRHGANPPAELKARPVRRHRRQSEPPPSAPRGEPKRMLELTNNCCRWPVTRRDARGIFFCGAPEADVTGGVPYCPYHIRRAYVIPPKRVAAVTRKAASAKQQSAASKPKRRYVWRAAVRHPASRWR